MDRMKLLLQLIVFTFVTATSSQDITNNPHSRQKRFVFYPGSVFQLAAGMAVPAEVKDKIIYTNYGIMINYDLPTNLSSLLPVTIIEEMRGSKSWDQLSTDVFLQFGWGSSCWRKLDQWADKNQNLNGSLIYEFATMILRERETNEVLRSRAVRDAHPALDSCPWLNG